MLALPLSKGECPSGEGDEFSMSVFCLLFFICFFPPSFAALWDSSGEINLGAKAHSSGEINLPSSQTALRFRAVPSLASGGAFVSSPTF